MSNNSIQLIKLSSNEGKEHYSMLQQIKADDNGFTNPANGLSYEDFKVWLREQDDWSKGKNLPKGYVRQTWYWLIVDGHVAGCGKIRQALTEQSRIKGGTIGYAIGPKYRGKGYGTIIQSLLLQKAEELRVVDKVLTVEKYNWASAKVIEKNGGVLYDENNLRWYYKI